MRLLVDECLSPELAAVAHNQGCEAYHVAYRGWAGLSDAQLLAHLIDEELVLVTNNRDDFLALVGGTELHPGLIVLVDNVRRSDQIALFSVALGVATALPSMINKVIEVRADGSVATYDLPQVE